MLAFLVMANINVGLKGSHVEGLEFGAWDYWPRPLFQPILIHWALFDSGVIWNRKDENPTNRSTETP